LLTAQEEADYDELLGWVDSQPGQPRELPPAPPADEVWAPLPGQGTKCEVSNYGSVRVLAYEGYRHRKAEWRPLKPQASAEGYLFVEVRGRRRAIHQLVLEAFVGPRPPGMEGCHNDDNPANNHISNLRWDTHAENMRDRVGNRQERT
jgi:hypothetical protein